MAQEVSSPALVLMLSARRLAGFERVVPPAQMAFGVLFSSRRCVWFGFARVSTLARDSFAMRPTARSVPTWTYLVTWFLQLFWGATIPKQLLSRVAAGQPSTKALALETNAPQR